MSILDKIKALRHPSKIIETTLRTPITGKFISDETAISILYRLRFHKKIDLLCPRTFNEKLLWLTLYDRRAVYNTIVDKYEAKQWIKQKLGGGTIPVVSYLHMVCIKTLMKLNSMNYLMNL